MDGVVLVMEETVPSTDAQIFTIEQFGKISGYKINKDKSVFMGFNISNTMNQSLLEIMPAKWSTGGFKYLGIIISKFYSQMTNENIIPIIRYIQDGCNR